MLCLVVLYNAKINLAKYRLSLYFHFSSLVILLYACFKTDKLLLAHALTSGSVSIEDALPISSALCGAFRACFHQATGRTNWFRHFC